MKVTTLASKLVEQQILCLILTNKEIMDRINILNVDDFFYADHKLIFSVMINLYITDEPCDLNGVIGMLKKNGFLEKITDGRKYVESLVNVPANANDLNSYVMCLAELAYRRIEVKRTTSRLDELYDLSEPVKTVIIRQEI